MENELRINTMFYLYDDPQITLNDWLCDNNTKIGHLDEQLYNHFKNHDKRTLNPEKANIFIIGIPIVKSFFTDRTNHYNNIIQAILKVKNNKYFQINQGKDHLILADHYELSAWADMFQNKEFTDMYQDTFEHVTSTRYEVYQKNKWISPPEYLINICPALTLLVPNWELTRYSIIVPYNYYFNSVIIPNYDEWNTRKFYVFYQESCRDYAHGASKLRKLPVEYFIDKVNCSIGLGLPINEYSHNMKNSKYVIVTRGDTSGSHVFVNSIGAGCIPVIISDMFEKVATPFNDIINLQAYTIIISEKDFVEDPHILFKTLDSLSELDIHNKINNLIEVQKLMLLEHPESTCCDAILNSFQIQIKL
uniref:Exostosin GT47 domain-containing protein n=1 Tax=viral metagenome TaxID=1070528 RepID=A0A6C0IJT1_9ZZZZ